MSQLAKQLRCRPAEKVRPIKRRTSWLSTAFVSAGFAAGSSVFAQYPPAGQPYSNPYNSGYAPIYAQPAPQEAANQSDEQLLTVGRLLEQQGRYAQAQRIYTELERRRLAGLQQPAMTPPNGGYPPPQGGMASQMAPPMAPQMATQMGTAPAGWQAAPPQMSSGAPAMQLAPPSNVPSNAPIYDQRLEMVASPSPPTNQFPPPAPPSEGYVVDTQYTPQPKTVGSSTTPQAGWRTSLAPIPAAFRAWNTDRPVPYQEQVSSGVSQPGQMISGSPMGMPNTAESSSLPDLPIAPVAPFGSIANQFPPTAPPPAPPATMSPEPTRFLSPTYPSARRPAPLGPERAAPTTMRLKPMPQKNLETLDSERETSQKQSDAIRIIPGGRLPAQLKPDAASLVDPRDQPKALSPTERPKLVWDPNTAVPSVPVEQRIPEKIERPPAENSLRFDLAAWVATPEFREIHTADVLTGLDLLSRNEPNHRAQGAMRIAAAGEQGRTALPVLRKVLATEADKTVCLRLAETVLRLQPNDRAATECLSELLTGRVEWQLRQAAASALGGAAQGRNTIAVTNLTDALDDPNPHVRAAAAASLGCFGRAAADSISRLENAAANDIRSVQRAASLALTSIRGGQSEKPAELPSATARENPFSFNPLPATRSAQLLGPTSTGRVTLSDELPPEQSAEPNVSDNDSAGPPPKLFPADRIAGSRLPTATPEMSDDDAVPVSATAPEAPSKPFKSVSPSPFQPTWMYQAQPQASPQPQAQPQPLTQPQPVSDVFSAQPAATSTFLLQSEAGSSKAGSKP